MHLRILKFGNAKRSARRAATAILPHAIWPPAIARIRNRLTSSTSLAADQVNILLVIGSHKRSHLHKRFGMRNIGVIQRRAMPSWCVLLLSSLGDGRRRLTLASATTIGLVFVGRCAVDPMALRHAQPPFPLCAPSKNLTWLVACAVNILSVVPLAPAAPQ